MGWGGERESERARERESESERERERERRGFETDQKAESVPLGNVRGFRLQILHKAACRRVGKVVALATRVILPHRHAIVARWCAPRKGCCWYGCMPLQPPSVPFLTDGMNDAVIHADYGVGIARSHRVVIWLQRRIGVAVRAAERGHGWR